MAGVREQAHLGWADPFPGRHQDVAVTHVLAHRADVPPGLGLLEEADQIA
jgi:hypothetical protein